MEEVTPQEVLSIRKRLGLSVKKLSELANINMTTLRQFELGKQKPQKKKRCNGFTKRSRIL